DARARRGEAESLRALLEELDEPEVEDLDLLVGAGARDHDVLGLEVAVDDVESVRRFEAGERLERERDGALDGEGARLVEERAEGPPRDELERHEEDALRAAELVD